MRAAPLSGVAKCFRAGDEAKERGHDRRGERYQALRCDYRGNAVSFRAEKGKFVVLLGLSGCGKAQA
jgi:ABC-type proline/glycine betaine transport system ATPase subunit